MSPWCAPPGTFQWEDVQRALQSVQEVPTELGADVFSILSQAQKYLDIVSGVLTDKALPDLAQRIRTISSINTSGPKAPAAPAAPADTSKPVNLDLQRFVKPLDAYIYYRRHTWILPVAIGGGVLLLAGLGFGIGRWTKSCKAKPTGAVSGRRYSRQLGAVRAVSKDRYRATASERRLYGGSTVTEFYVYRDEDRNNPAAWKIVTGYGRTPGERKTDAIRRSGLET